MYLTSKIILHPTVQQEKTLSDLISIYISQVNECLSKFIDNQKIIWIPYSTINKQLPWESKKEVIKEAKSIFNDHLRKRTTQSACFKGKYCKWHFDSFTLNTKLNLQVGQQQSKLIVEYYADSYQKKLLSSGFPTSLRIEKVNQKWYCYIKILIPDPQPLGEHIMGVDLGIKVPAVAVTSKGKVRFFGNGRQVRYICTSQSSRLSKLMRKNDFRSIRNIDRKWGNRLLSIDHQISKAIIDFALKENVKKIILENLTYLQKRTNASRKIATWSYFRLKSLIEYKAQKNGIEIQIINPYNTSKKCPNCNKLNTCSTREYLCGCGYKNHRDIVGAINICNYNSVLSN
jgi:putative transposase